MMNFWTPTFSGWGDGLNDWDMPWYVHYDWVEVYAYDHSSKQFHLSWRDDFNGANYSSPDLNRWYPSDGWGFDSNSSTFYKNHVYIYNN